MKTLDELVAESPFFSGLDTGVPRADRGLRPEHRLRGRRSYLFREGDQADTFYLVRHGRVRWRRSSPAAAR